MDLSVFFDKAQKPSTEDLPSWSLGRRIGSFEAWQEADILLIGAPDAAQATQLASAIRNELWYLSVPDKVPAVADLGNFKAKDDWSTYEDSFSYVMEYLIEQGKTIVILADHPGFTFAQYRAYEQRKTDLSYVHIGPVFDLDPPFEANPEVSYNQRILRHEPNYLFGFSSLGYQRYFVSPEAIKSLSDLHCATMRYGELEAHPEEAEPYLRDATLLSLDLSAMRSADMPAASRPSPAGFSTQEICKLTRYAGLSESLSSMLISGMTPAKDLNQLGAKAAALTLWYFLEGRGQRRPDAPESTWRRYAVTMQSPPHQIDFLHSPRSGRWWMEVPYPEALGRPGTGPVRRVACTRKDYEAAQRDELPQRWWHTQYRLS
jgi:arginase family enzyme